MLKLPLLTKTLKQAYGARKAKRLVALVTTNMFEQRKEGDPDCSEVSGCFTWIDSEQGHEFWSKVNRQCCRITGADF